MRLATHKKFNGGRLPKAASEVRRESSWSRYAPPRCASWPDWFSTTAAND